MQRFRYITYAVLGMATVLALVPVGRMASGWANSDLPSTHSTDWIRWTVEDGSLVADYIHPGSPAAQAGLREGDRLYMFGYQPYRTHASLQAAVAAVPPGESRAYHIYRDGRFERLSVTLTSQPAFLYPLSPGLWNFSLWSFAFGAFFHLLGLIVVAPLVWRSRRARFSMLLLGASSLWVFSTLLRLVVVETTGLPPAGTSLRPVFDGLSLASAVGWGSFPALLLHKVVCDTQEAAGQSPTALRFVVYLPFLALTLTAVLAAPATARVSLLHLLVAPVLLYTCCFVAAAAVLVLSYLRLSPASAPPGSWSATGGAVLLVSSVLAATLVLLNVPFFHPVAALSTGWLVSSVQLLSTVPVALVTLATLRYTTPSGLFMRALTYVTVLGIIFFAFVGGYTLIDAYLGREGPAHHVVAGLFVVLLLLVFERMARRLRLYASQFFSTCPQRAREALGRFQEQMRTILTHESLAQQTAATVGEAFEARSVRLFLRAADPAEANLASKTSPSDTDRASDGDKAEEAPNEWVTGTYHPEPPYLTQRHFERIWPYMRHEGRVWARNPELRDSTLPEQRAQILEERGVALAFPIIGDEEPIGLLALGGKKKRGELYNLADLDLLRFLSGQLALATERLDLVARERALVRASAQAELAALRAQINPHFLFNALNTIASLIEVQPSKAESTVEHLAAIFRHILQTGSQSFVPLEEELALVRHYLHIEQVRFGDALEVKIDLPSSLRPSSVPAFAVQTLVENAVKHGIAKKRGGGHVHVTARRLRSQEKGAVEIVVDDTGAGIPVLFPTETSGDGAASPSTASNGASAPRTDQTPPSEANENAAQTHPSFYGIGLRNVADRLERLYDRTDLLQLQSAPGKGTTAYLRLPPSPSPDPQDASSGAPPEALRHV